MQSSFSALDFAAKRKLTRRDRILREVDAVTPLAELAARIEPFYPKGTGRFRPPIGLVQILRMYVVQQCLGLSDEGIEDAVYESQAIHGFIGVDQAPESAPDATTLLKFCRLLEAHGLMQAIFEAINAHLGAKGLLLRDGSVVDATIIRAPSSTKNDCGSRDPEMHQPKKGKNWLFGKNAQIGADRDFGLVYTVVGTAANVFDVTVGNALLHGEDTDVLAHAGYQGADKRDNATGANWHVAMRPRVCRRWKKQPRMGTLLDSLERVKAARRAKVEHPFHIVNRFSLEKMRYRGLAKNTPQLFTPFGLANLLIAKPRLIDHQARGAS